MRLVALLALFATVLVQSSIPGKVFVDPVTNVFRDGKNRTLMWRGTNFVEKGPPYYPTITDSDITTLKQMGFNVARLGVMMGGLFPTNRTADVNYLNIIEGIINRFWAAGIATIIDLHQDILSPKLCGEGVPDWMFSTESLRAMDFPLPATIGANVTLSKANDLAPGGWVPPINCQPAGWLSFIGWSEFYVTDANGKAWAQIYSGNGLLATMFEEYWRTVARRFRNLPGVLMYELLNEPWLGDILVDPMLLFGIGDAERKNVAPFMQRMYNVVRREDPETLTLYSPAELNNRLMRSVGFETGFLKGEPMAFHIYCLTGTDGDGPTDSIGRLLCNFNDGLQLDVRVDDLKKLQTAGFVTEFGAVSAKPTGLAEVRYVTEIMDAADPPLSWTFWANIPRDTIYRTELARSYAPVIAGTPRSVFFNATTHIYALNYAPNPVDESDPEGSTSTIVLSRTFHYPNGFDILVQPTGCCEVKEAIFGLTVRVLKPYDGTPNINVLVTAK